MKHLPSANAAPMAVGIQFSVGLSALGSELNQIKQALQEPQQILTLRNDLIADHD
ncbi:beta-ketoacyl-[acyl-carrier-protein] synthase II, partial [Escherichia coli]